MCADVWGLSFSTVSSCSFVPVNTGALSSHDRRIMSLLRACTCQTYLSQKQHIFRNWYWVCETWAFKAVTCDICKQEVLEKFKPIFKLCRHVYSPASCCPICVLGKNAPVMDNLQNISLKKDAQLTVSRQVVHMSG